MPQPLRDRAPRVGGGAGGLDRGRLEVRRLSVESPLALSGLRSGEVAVASARRGERRPKAGAVS